MQYPLFDFLCSSLVPILCAYIAAGSSGNVHFILIGIAAVRAFPDKLAMLVLDDVDLAVVAANMAIIALGIKLGVHDIVVNKLHYRQYRVEIVLHIGNLDVGYRASGGERLELRLQSELIKRVDVLGHVNVIAVGDIILVRDALDYAEALLQAFCELVGGAFERGAVKRVIDRLIWRYTR